MNDYNPKMFGQKIRECRNAAEPRRVTQEDLAGAIGKTASLISRYENGVIIGTMDLDMLGAIVRYLRESGTPENLLDELNSLSGNEVYSVEGTTNAVATAVGRLLDELARIKTHPSASAELEGILRALIDDWKRYYNAVSDLDAGWHPPVNDSFKRLLKDISKEASYRSRLRIYALRGLASGHKYERNPVDSETRLDEAKNLALELLDHEGLEKRNLAEILTQRGDIRRRLSKWDAALDDFDTSYKIYREIQDLSGKEQHREFAMLERKRAGTLLFKGEPQNALEHCELSINHYRKAHDRDQELKSVQHKAWALAMLGDWGEALKLHKNVIEVLGVDPDRWRDRAKAHRFLGDVYRMCGLLNDAKVAYDTAIKTFEQNYKHNIAEEPIIYGAIQLGRGSTFRAESRYIEATSCLEGLSGSAMYLFSDSKAKYYVGLVRSELSRLALAQQDVRQAVYDLKEAKKIFEQLGNYYYLAAMHVNSAKLEYATGNFSEARAEAVKAVNLAKEHGFNVHRVRAEMELAAINLAEPDREEPYQLYAAALNSARRLSTYLVHEVLCHEARRPHFVASEAELRLGILNMCAAITINREEYKGMQGAKGWIKTASELQEEFEGFAPSFAGGRALVIGIDTYPKMRNLSRATNDARDVSSLLTDSGYSPSDVTLLLDGKATKANIDMGLEQLARNAKPDDTVVIFFSGHGEQFLGGLAPGEYLYPFEADRNDVSNTAISSEEMTKALAAIPAKRVVVFLDACHSGGVGEVKGFGDEVIKAGFSEAAYEQIASSGRVVIASCHPNEFSYEIPGMDNGLFTHYLLRGLRGEASSKENGTVGVLDLFVYVSNRVPKRRPSQNPLIVVGKTTNFPIIP